MQDYVVKGNDRIDLITDGPCKLFFLAEQNSEPVLLYATAGPSRARLRMPHFPGSAVVSVANDADTSVEVSHFHYHAGETPDPTPVEIPLHLDRPETFEDQVRRIVSTQMSFMAQRAGAASFEEEDDFEVDEEFEEFDIPTRYEMTEETPITDPDAPEDLPEEPAPPAPASAPPEASEPPPEADD